MTDNIAGIAAGLYLLPGLALVAWGWRDVEERSWHLWVAALFVSLTWPIGWIVRIREDRKRAFWRAAVRNHIKETEHAQD